MAQEPTRVAHSGLSFADALREGLSPGIVLLDPAAAVTWASASAGRIFGWTGPGTAALASRALPSPVLAMLQAATSSPEKLRSGVVEFRGASGELLAAQIQVITLPGDRGAQNYLLLAHDASSGRSFEQHVERLDRLASLGTLAASMAHEIKNALVACKTFAELLVEQHQDEELAGLVSREMGRIESIVGRMLKFSGSAVPSRSPVRLHEILEHSLRLILPQLESKGVRLERAFAPGEDLLLGDSSELQQALVNLFLNAVDAMGPEGTLSVSTQFVTADDSGPGQPKAGPGAGEARVRLQVQDTGAGIAPEHLAKLFTPFFTTKAAGTGLGLAITRRILEAHGGRIAVHSRLGHGTVFEIELPVARPGPEGPPAALT